MDRLQANRLRHRGGIRGVHLITICRKAIAAGLPVTFNRNFLEPGYKAKPFETPINEVEFIPIAQTIPNKLKWIFEPPKEEYTGSIEQYADEIVISLKSYLRKVWPSGNVLFSHSAGYDSRIISHCLIELQAEGNFDIGNVHFRCHQPENEVFYKVMRKQGWNPDIFSGDENLPPVDHYDTGRTDRPVNGWTPMGHASNWWRDIVPYNQEKNWTFVSGTGGGEMFNYPSRDVPLMRDWPWCKNKFLDNYLNHFLYNWQWGGDLEHRFKGLILPYFSYEYLAVAAKCPRRFIDMEARPGGGKIDRVRAAVMRSFEVNTFDIEYGPGHRYEWQMSMDRKAKMMEFWRGCKLRKDENLPETIDPFEDIAGHDSRLWAFAVTYEHIMR